jgi:hypothetical protein
MDIEPFVTLQVIIEEVQRLATLMAIGGFSSIPFLMIFFHR